jgi:hypothetical protein
MKQLTMKNRKPSDFLWDRKGNSLLDRALLKQRKCRVCGEYYFPRRRDQKQCSKRCAWRWHDIHRDRSAKNLQQSEYKRQKRLRERAAVAALREFGVVI